MTTISKDTGGTCTLLVNPGTESSMDLVATTEAKHQVKCGLLDVVVRQGAAVLQLLASKDQTLLV